MDWRLARSLPEREQMRLLVENWKQVGPELERSRRDELRAMSEEEAFEQAQVVGVSATSEMWIASDRAASLGLVEQQRLFARNRPSAL